MFRTFFASAALVALVFVCGCADMCVPEFNNYIGPNPGAVADTAVGLPQPIPSTQLSATKPVVTTGSAADTEPVPAAPPATMATVTGEPVTVSVQDAGLLAMEHNLSLVVQRYSPLISWENIQIQRATFDPVLSGNFRWRQSRTPALGLVGANTLGNITSRQINWSTLDTTTSSLTLSEFLPTGTEVAVTASASTINPGGALSDNARLELDVTQHLLQGGGCDVNLAALRQAKLSALSSEYQLRGFAEALLGTTEQTYWNYALAMRQIDLVVASLQLAEQSLSEVRERVKVGKLAETELAAAEAEVAQRQLDLIVARANMQTTRLQLLRLINPQVANLWERPVVLVHEPSIPDITLPDVENYVRVAMRMRPDLNQARLQVLQNDLQLVVTKNGLLPVLDLFVALGKTGYADSFGDSWGHIGDKGWDITIGVSGSYPILNRAAIAANAQAVYTRDQSKAAVANLEQLVQTDVRDAYIQVVRFKEQIFSSAVARRAQQETLRAETEKFQVGKSTSFLVAQAQRDLLSSQLVEVQAQVNYLNAMVDLYRLDGSLLIRRGIQAPGDQPVTAKGMCGAVDLSQKISANGTQSPCKTAANGVQK